MKLPDSLKNPTIRMLLESASAVSAGLLAVALVSQYGFNLHPCELCMAQRYPYALILLIGLLAAFFAKNQRVLVYAAWLCVALFFADAAIAIYHSGVEWGVFPGPSGCTSSDKPGESLEDMRRAIMNAQLVPCDQPMAHVLGLSMAAWNAVAAAFSGLAMVFGLRHLRRRN